MRKLLLSVVVTICLALPSWAATNRGGLEFGFANEHVQVISTVSYLSFDVMVRGSNTGDRLGTGIVLINYDPTVFGYRVKTHNSLIVTKGSLLQSAGASHYNLYTADSLPTRIGLTYEYFLQSGSGSMVPSEFTQLLNVKVKIREFNLPTGISFYSNGMSMQQYLDDNTTIFSPVSASSTISEAIPSSPAITSIHHQNAQVSLSWLSMPNCNYTVWSAAEPNSEAWVAEAANLSSCTWTGAETGSRRFYKVTAHSIAYYEGRRSEIEP